MFCYHCGEQLSDQARFCSRCGRDTSDTRVAAAPAPKAPRDMGTHVAICGWLLVGSAILWAALGIVLLIAGRIVVQAPIPLPPEMPEDLFRFIIGISNILGLAILATAALIAVAGVGLLQYQAWGRTLALIASAILILKFPIGTIIGVYTFWVLLSREGREHYQRRSATVQ